MNIYKRKSLSLILFTLISTYPYLTKTGWFVHIETRERISLYVSKDYKYDIKLKDLKVIIEDIEWNNEYFDPQTNTLHLSPLCLDIR
jgi:hypothetical protein